MSTGSPPRRRKNDRSEIPVSFLPEGNPAARAAYLCAIIGLIPGLGLFLGPAAIVFGVRGGWAADRDEFHRGKGHAKLSRLLGALETICGVAGWSALAIGSF